MKNRVRRDGLGGVVAVRIEEMVSAVVDEEDRVERRCDDEGGVDGCGEGLGPEGGGERVGFGDMDGNRWEPPRGGAKFEGS